MKSFYKLFFLTLFVGTVCSSATFAAENQNRQSISPEVSALFLTPEFAKISSALKQRAASSGRVLKISAVAVESISDKTFVYIHLQQRVAADSLGKWEPFGDIVGSVLYGQNGEIGFDGMWFAESGQPPGGATVGN